jgi:predicted nuclease of predicted toxin-antitoxin system
MEILLDEMYAGLKEHFQLLGWNVSTVQDIGLQGAKDIEIVKYAKENDMLLVTQDPKSASLAELAGVKYVLISNAMIAKITDAKIREKYPEICTDKKA